MQKLTHSSLAKCNVALRAGQYPEAIRYHAQIQINTPDLGNDITTNLALAGKNAVFAAKAAKDNEWLSVGANSRTIALLFFGLGDHDEY